ncbi:MAG: GTP 3',8-cyclase MoaA, partial [Bacteroidota bacterium]
MKPILIDRHKRVIDYVRLAVTDRCNLRCFYCMPAEGIDYLPRTHLLTYEEMERLLGVMASQGVRKVRITGGEPFVRKGMIDFLARVKQIPGIEALHLTSNGVLSGSYVAQLKSLGLDSFNLSLDTLDRARFQAITRRDELPRVLACLHQLLQANIPTKINAVVMEGKNVRDLVALAELSREHPLEVRFIEEMPFNGGGAHYPTLHWNQARILKHLKAHYPNLYRIESPTTSTSTRYQIPGYQGKVGIIAAFSRSFCGTCNRIRVTPQGSMRTCLYGEGVLNFRDLMRA